MLLWGILWIWYYNGCLEYDLVLLNETSSISMFIVISVLIGAMGKSAQILFHVWLADAMEGLNYLRPKCATDDIVIFYVGVSSWAQCLFYLGDGSTLKTLF
jgi:hypothetical protein